MNRRLPTCILLALTLSLAMSPERAAFALERVRPQELLERIRQAQEPTPPLVRQLEYTMVADYADHPEKQERLQMIVEAYLDTEKAGRRMTTRRWTGEGDVGSPTEQFGQEVWNGERFYSVGKWYPEPGVSLWGGGTGTTGQRYETRLRATYVGAELGGVLYSDYEPYYKILKNSKKIKVRIDEQAFGVATYRVEAKTERGFYQIWVDPEQGYHLRRAIIEKGAEDLGWGDVSISEYERSPKESIRYTLTNSKFETVDGQIFPVEGRAVVETVFLKDGPGGSASSAGVTDIRITSMELNPDFDVLQAFTIDAPPMTPMTDWGNGNKFIVWTGTGLSSDEDLLEEAQRSHSAVLRAAREPRPNIYDEELDGRELIAAAVERAKAEGRHVLVTWGANWCGWCHELEGLCRMDPDVKDIIDAHYVPRIDRPGSSGQEYGSCP